MSIPDLPPRPIVPLQYDYGEDTDRGRFIELIRHARGAVVPHDRCLFALYGNRDDGGPLHARYCLGVMAYKLRKLGYPIHGRVGLGGYYWRL